VPAAASLAHITYDIMNQPLAEAIFWIGGLACAVAEIMILRSSFAATRENKSPLVPTASRASELTWALLPGIALSVLLVATWRNVQERTAHAQMNHSRMEPGMHMPRPER
jgi:heme/copper-type cytochrome/quinol oxidase subunit 2